MLHQIDFMCDLCANSSAGLYDLVPFSIALCFFFENALAKCNDCAMQEPWLPTQDHFQVSL